MTALLTSERNDTDKIVEYVNEAGRMGLSVLPPDVNESEVMFKAVDQKTIRFGLLAVKNVGAAAAESIVEARQKAKFSSLEDLCQRIDLRLANRKVLESLIKCGALDTFLLPRAQMFASLDGILEGASRMQKDKARGQISFFDESFSTNGFKQAALNNSTHVKEWPEPQLLAFEKDMIGFYLSGHPLARYARQLKRFASTSTSVLRQHADEESMKIVGLILKVKHTITRAKQEKMAIMMLEDLEGTVEVLVFPRAFQKVSRYLLPGSVVLIKGTLNLKEETPKIIAEDLFPVDEIYKLITGMKINLSGIRENIFESLKTLLAGANGNIPVYLHLDTPTKTRTHIVVGEGLYVNPSEKLIQDIEELLGEERLSLVI
jgi:DNA polymerase-3 subunit alpha